MSDIGQPKENEPMTTTQTLPTTATMAEVIALGLTAAEVTEALSGGAKLLDLLIEQLDTNAEYALANDHGYTPSMLEKVIDSGDDQPGALHSHLQTLLASKTKKTQAVTAAPEAAKVSMGQAKSPVAATSARISINLAAGEAPKRSDFPADTAGELDFLRAKVAHMESASSKGRKITVAVSPKTGAVSVYGLGRFPTTMYAQQWETLLNSTVVAAINEFIASSPAGMVRK